MNDVYGADAIAILLSGRRDNMKLEIYGHQYRTLRGFIKAVILRQVCSLTGHAKAKFHACTCIERLPDGMNANIGVSFVCPTCHYSKAGDIISGL
jgi:hypothetical protein